MSTPYNYFNYFTEIEEYFWQKRGAALIRPPVEWELIETWQRQGIPLAAVRKGIDRAFESWGRSRRRTPLKSLLYCNDAVLQVAEEMREARAGSTSGERVGAPGFSPEEIARFLRGNASSLRRAGARGVSGSLARDFGELAAALEALAASPQGSGADAVTGLEELERHLTVLEEKLLAAIQQSTSTEELVGLRREVEGALAPYRRRMKAEQLMLLERQLLQKKLFEHYSVPRLSLFYLPTPGGPASSLPPSPAEKSR